jgi:hypothetical protein
VKITKKRYDDDAIWYQLLVRGVNPKLLGMELRAIFGKERVLKIDSDYPESHTVWVAVDRS